MASISAFVLSVRPSPMKRDEYFSVSTTPIQVALRSAIDAERDGGGDYGLAPPMGGARTDNPDF